MLSFAAKLLAAERSVTREKANPSYPGLKDTLLILVWLIRDELVHLHILVTSRIDFTVLILVRREDPLPLHQTLVKDMGFGITHLL